ncbi:hypothetical protein QBC34DRAFT_498243 [Podospora aff. communis PSN243]|uniref:Uncharacterized protein n=1 Tax=Podospora aff. communis PSN243 TaxID=3040156 RepID=A0AAV9G7V3_9PEZI|nr:hypothetical protein QBC34DRAFT_498243 [Podospora aff. communis PSN243]
MNDLNFTPNSPGNCPEMAYGSCNQPNVDHRIDSGYSSLTATPASDASSEQSSGRLKIFGTEDGEAETCARRLFSPRSDLDCFEKPLDDATLHWFETTSPRIEQLLVEFLKSGRRFLSPKFKPMAVRLMVLGRSETAARPHLVVFSPPKGSKRVEKFFAREEVKDLLVPTGCSNPVAVVVAEHTTSFLMCLVSDVKALCSSDITDRRSRHTLCGLPITVNSRRMTLGGIIRVLGPPADGVDGWTFYGLTAGHFADRFAAGEEGELEDSDDDSDTDSNTDKADDDPMHDAPMGLVTPDLDWSLIHMNCLLPNFLDSMSRDQRGGDYRMADLVPPRLAQSSAARFPNSSVRNVVVLSGTRGLQRGRLPGGLSRVMLGQSPTFTNAYILKLETGTVGQGDSGSWVVDPGTSEVLGHVVAKDLFGDAYVIPMADTLKAIKYQLGCTDVGLPTSLDILSAPKRSKGLGDFPLFNSPPGSPKTPTSDGTPPDSGYNTNPNCTPYLVLLESSTSRPTTPEAQGPIPTFPVEDSATTRMEKVTSSSGAEVNGPMSDQSAMRADSGDVSTLINKQRPEDKMGDVSGAVSAASPISTGSSSASFSSRYSSGSSSRYSSSGPSSGSSVSCRSSERRYRSRGYVPSSGYAVQVGEIPRPRGPDIVLFQHHRTSSADQDEGYHRQSTHGSSSRDNSYYK